MGRHVKPIPHLPVALVRRYVAGELGRDALAAAAGLTPYAAQRALVYLGVYREKGAAMSAHYAAAQGERRAEVVRRRAAGQTYAEIGTALGISDTRVGQLLDAYGPRRRKRLGRPTDR